MWRGVVQDMKSSRTYTCSICCVWYEAPSEFPLCSAGENHPTVWPPRSPYNHHPHHHTERGVCLSDSMNLLQKVESGMGCPDWHTAMHSLRLQRLLWIYCPGHAGVSGNERADRLASTADITSGLQLGRAEVLRGLRNFLSTDKPEHHSIDRLKERGVEKGSGRHSTLQGRERSVFNQTNIGTVSRATLGRLLRDGAERVWAFPSATMPSWAETETETERGESRLLLSPHCAANCLH